MSICRSDQEERGAAAIMRRLSVWRISMIHLGDIKNINGAEIVPVDEYYKWHRWAERLGYKEENE